MSFMKDLYEQIAEAVKQLKIKPCVDTYTELEKLLNRSVPSDGSEDVIKYYTFKTLLKSKAIIPGNIASNDNIRYMALWMTPEMIVRHFDLQNYIELTFAQSNRFVHGDYIRGDYTVKEATKTTESTTRSDAKQGTVDKKDDFTVVGSRKSTPDRNKYQKNNNNPRHNSTSSMNRTVRYKPGNSEHTVANIAVKKETSRLTKSYDHGVSESSSSSNEIAKNNDELLEPNLRSSINWNASKITSWADADEDDSD